MKISSKNQKAVVLLSGGIDSAVVLFLAKKKGYQVKALTFDYRQKHKKEIKCAQKLALAAEVDLCCLKIEMPWVQSSLISKEKNIKAKNNLKLPLTYVPGRNIIFLSFAVSYAESINAGSIFIGAHVQDYSGYPDCRRSFLQSLNKAVNLGIAAEGIKFCYPLIKKNKKEIIQLGFRLKVPFELTWSCYKGGNVPCFDCDSCFFRNKAFSQLGLKDPWLVNNASGKNN